MFLVKKFSEKSTHCKLARIIVYYPNDPVYSIDDFDLVMFEICFCHEVFIQFQDDYAGIVRHDKPEFNKTIISSHRAKSKCSHIPRCFDALSYLIHRYN